jgi:putative peptidoglycan lipid II flippase
VKRPGIASTTLRLVPVQIILRGGEAAMPLLMAVWFGRNDATDIYYFSWAVFALAGSVVFSAYQESAFVPIYIESRLRTPEKVPALLGSLVAHTLLIGGAIALTIGMVALGIFRARYDDAGFAIAARMVPAFSVHLVVLSLRTLFGTLLVADRRFFIPSLAGAIGMVINVGFIFALYRVLGVVAVAFGTLLGELAAAGFAYYVARLAGVRLAFNLVRHEPLRRLFKLLAAEVGGGAVARVNPVVDQFMATLTGIAGAGTLLRLSGDVATVPTGIVQAALFPVLVTHIAEDHAAGERAKIRHTVGRAVLVLSAVLVGCGVILFLVRRPLLRFVFLHGQMDEAGVEQLAELLPYHLAGLWAFGALLVLVRAHTSIQNGGILFRIGLLNAGLNAGLNLILVRVLGLGGIALSTSCVNAVIAGLLWLMLRKKLG